MYLSKGWKGKCAPIALTCGGHGEQCYAGQWTACPRAICSHVYCHLAAWHACNIEFHELFHHHMCRFSLQKYWAKCIIESDNAKPLLGFLFKLCSYKQGPILDSDYLFLISRTTFYPGPGWISPILILAFVLFVASPVWPAWRITSIPECCQTDNTVSLSLVNSGTGMGGYVVFLLNTSASCSLHRHWCFGVFRLPSYWVLFVPVFKHCSAIHPKQLPCFYQFIHACSN